MFSSLHQKIREKLKEIGFTKPTEIQKHVFQSYKHHRNFLIASQTGSGKTLAFGLPIISEMLDQQAFYKKQKIISALILTPTRELALQIRNHLLPFLERKTDISCLVGGMSRQKQRRVLDSTPLILVATPGRLWDFIENEQIHKLSQIKFLVIDEADRMVELGHYKELDNIIDKIMLPSVITHDKEIIKDVLRQKSEPIQLNNKSEMFDIEPDQIVEMDYQQFLKLQKGKKLRLKQKGDQNIEFSSQDEENEEYQEENLQVEAENAEENEEQNDDEEAFENIEQQDENFQDQLVEEEQEATDSKNNYHPKLRIFLVSATLTKEFLTGSKHKKYRDPDRQYGKQKPSQDDQAPKLSLLIGKLKLKENLKLIDLTQKLLFPEKLEFYKSILTEDEKLLYLYNFLSLHKGETFIIFMNSITYGKKVHSMLKVLGVTNIESVQLHSSQQQRQRIKRLERFTRREVNVLVCTDVAARGLDIKDVENVVHYQIPFTVDTFVHRCGRTARIGKAGKTLCLVGPKDMVRYAKLEKDLQSNQVVVKDYELSYHEKEKIREMISKAQEVERFEHQLLKKNKKKSELQKQLKQDDFYEDEKEVQYELEQLNEEILTKKRIIDQKRDQYKQTMSQKHDNFTRRRNGVFLNPNQIEEFSQKIKGLQTRNKV